MESVLHLVCRFASLRVLALTGLLLTSGLVPTADASVAATWPPSLRSDVTFERAICPIAPPDGLRVDCGQLVVPERRDGTSDRTLRLAVAILRSTAPAPEPDPIVYLEGGPGLPALRLLDGGLDRFLPFLERRDVILIDQRGTGFSQPALNCPEFVLAQVTLLQQPDPTALADGTVAAAFACRDRLVTEGIDLGAYDSAASAADVLDLRQVLGYDQINLYAISYGTRVALEVMRVEPSAVRSAILDSVVPPSVDDLLDVPVSIDRALDAVFAACAADPVCATVTPDLAATFDGLVTRLNAASVEIPFVDPTTGTEFHFVLTGDILVGFTVQALYRTDAIAQLPSLFAALDAGLYQVLPPLLSEVLSSFGAISDGAYYSVVCREEVAAYDQAAIEAALSAVPRLVGYNRIDASFGALTYAICADWGAPPADPIAQAPVVSDVPTLVLAGEYDPITPPSYGVEVTKTLSQSWLIELAGQSHAVTAQSSCALGLATAFVEMPAEAPEAECASLAAGLVFHT